jgi:glycosyltransferase involved in cell wall biosynthesis
VIRRERKLGYGSAVIEGFRAALKGDYAWILQMDADLSHDPAAIPALIRAASDHDLVLGSRYIGGVRVIDWEIGRVLLSWMSNGYARRHPPSGPRRHHRLSLLSTAGARGPQPPNPGGRLRLPDRSGSSRLALRGRLTEVPITFYGRRKASPSCRSG